MLTKLYTPQGVEKKQMGWENASEKLQSHSIMGKGEGRVLLERSGEGGRGSRGWGEGVQGGGIAPLPKCKICARNCNNVPQ